ncbi:MAG: hypothetical protein ABIJ16_06110, partial [Bacteroidota bacterium]
SIDDIVSELNEKVNARVAELSDQKKRKFSPWLIRIAAAVAVLLLITTLVLVSFMNNKTSEVFTQYFEPYNSQQKTIVADSVYVERGLVDELINEPYEFQDMEEELQEQTRTEGKKSGERESTVTKSSTGQSGDGITNVTRHDDNQNFKTVSTPLTIDAEEHDDTDSDDRFKNDLNSSGDNEIDQDIILSRLEEKEEIAADKSEDEKKLAKDAIVCNTETADIRSNRAKEKDRNKPEAGKDIAKTEAQPPAGNLKLTLDCTIVYSDEAPAYFGVSQEYRNADMTGGAYGGTVNDRFMIAMDLYQKKQYKEAIIRFENVIKDEPTHYQALFYSAVSYLSENMPDKEIKNLDKVIMIKDGNLYEAAVWYKSLALIRNDNPEPARTLLEDIIDMGGEYKGKAEEVLEQIK